MIAPDAQPKAHIAGIYDLGSTTVPVAIEMLGAGGVDITTVALLRKIWCRGGCAFTILDHSTAAGELGIKRQTVWRKLTVAEQQNLLEKRISKQKAKTRGYLCEYRILWKTVFDRLGYDYDPDHQFSGEESDWIANSVSTLPACWFTKGRFLDRTARNYRAGRRDLPTSGELRRSSETRDRKSFRAAHFSMAH